MDRIALIVDFLRQHIEYTSSGSLCNASLNSKVVKNIAFDDNRNETSYIIELVHYSLADLHGKNFFAVEPYFMFVFLFIFLVSLLFNIFIVGAIFNALLRKLFRCMCLHRSRSASHIIEEASSRRPSYRRDMAITPIVPTRDAPAAPRDGRVSFARNLNRTPTSYYKERFSLPMPNLHNTFSRRSISQSCANVDLHGDERTPLTYNKTTPIDNFDDEDLYGTHEPLPEQPKKMSRTNTPQMYAAATDF